MVIVREIIRPKSFGPAIHQTIICMRDANIDCLLEKHNSKTLVRERVLPVRFCGSEGLITEPIFMNDVLSLLIICVQQVGLSVNLKGVVVLKYAITPCKYRGKMH